MYSEILKPSDKMPTLDQLVKKKGSFEAVLRSVGKTNATVNRLAGVLRIAGPFTVALDLTMTAVVVKVAKPEEREREAVRMGGGMAAAAVAGTTGMWAGCATLAALASPSLVIPIVGEITEATACFVGGVLGGMGLGSLGRWVGEGVATTTYDSATAWEWK